MRFKILFLISFLVSFNLYAAVCSYDNTFVANDVYSSDFHTRLNENFTCVGNSANNVVAAQVTNDTLTEADMADEINPRIRTYEGASCEFVYTGLLPVSDTDLTIDIPAGTAYPRGYRVRKDSATANTFTASVWTYTDIDQNGDFQYSEVAIGAAAPAVATNSIRLFRASADTTAVIAIQDLRTTTCNAGQFDELYQDTNEATLLNLLENGSPIKKDGTEGFLQGLHIEFNTASQFTVKQGGAWINGHFRIASSDITVTTANDDPTLGTSGLDTGSIAADTNYSVYAVADEESVSSLSITYSTNSSTPGGVTNYRKLGQIRTDVATNFTSTDITYVNNISERELVGAWINFDSTASVPTSYDSFGVSALSTNTVGDFTISWTDDFVNANYAFLCTAGDVGNPDCRCMGDEDERTVGAMGLEIDNSNGTLVNCNTVSAIAIGEKT